MSAVDYATYLESYCDHFELWPFIKLKTRVLSVTRGGSRAHRITYTADSGVCSWDCDAVAVCSGLHVEPNIPDIEGLENAPCVMHSSDFKSREQFRGRKTIMVIGCGETGADISHLAVTRPETERVIVCHRDGFHFAPKVNRRIPRPYLL